MNTPLRSKIANKVSKYRPQTGDPSPYEIADEILSLVASKMPEKKAEKYGNLELLKSVGFNECRAEVLSILKGGTDE